MSKFELDIKNEYTKEIDTQVDFDKDGEIYDIRVWSHTFEDFIQIDKAWLMRNLRSRFDRIQKLIFVERDNILKLGIL